MEKLVFFLVFTCLIAAHVNSTASLKWVFSNQEIRKTANTKIENKPFNVSEIHIDESQLTDRNPIEQRENDIIKSLPGQPKVTFKQYGGYVTVNPESGKAFYYYFVEAWKSPETSPLIIWLNGGPGCSSLGYGAMEELGPFRVLSDGKTLYANPYAWNRVANVLFVESPAGVGFSYSNMTADFISGGDKKTVIDNYVFIVNWLQRFPEYIMKDVYITGESYAGHYVPQLAQIILQQNKIARTIIRLEGIMIGNAVINDDTDNEGLFKYWGSHALISDDLTNQVLKYCGFGFSPKGRVQQKACNKVLEKANELLDQIDINNIYGLLCHDSKLTDKPKKASIFEFDPCSENYVHAYLNRADVQKALHCRCHRSSVDL